MYLLVRIFTPAGFGGLRSQQLTENNVLFQQGNVRPFMLICSEVAYANQVLQSGSPLKGKVLIQLWLFYTNDKNKSYVIFKSR